MTYTHRIKNGVRIELTAKEITDLEANDVVWNNGAFDRALTELRQIRNKRLAETDWTSNSDVTMSSDMKTYRQALRDLTNGLDTVAKVEAKVFPTKPSE